MRLPEPLYQDDVPFGVLDSRKEKSVAVRREVRSPDVKQARQVRDLADMPSVKVEVVEGKVMRSASHEVNAVPRWNPAYVGGHS